MNTEVFRRRLGQPVVGYNLLTLLKHLKPAKGVVGIEVEVEGNQFPKPPGHEMTHKPVKMEGWKYWSYVKDGSLRGNDNAEYVLTKPIEFVKVPEALNELTVKLQEYGSKLDDSNRTSVHIHLNAQSFHMNRLASFISLYLCFEEVLTEWCGDHRVGNLFCLRGKDAPGAVTKIKKFIQSDGRTELGDNLHYAGLNTNALTKLGSLEIRSLRGVTDFSAILDWISILERLYTLSAEFTDPRDIPATFSQHGPMSFFNTILSDAGIVVRNGIDFDDEKIRDSMYEGIRLAQDICYCRDWSLFKPTDLKADPFGRDIRSLNSYLEEMGYPNPVTTSISSPIFVEPLGINHIQTNPFVVSTGIESTEEEDEPDWPEFEPSEEELDGLDGDEHDDEI